MCAYHFCGPDHLIFATDMPFGNQLGERLVRETIRSVKEMDISDAERKMIFEENAQEAYASADLIDPVESGVIVGMRAMYIQKNMGRVNMKSGKVVLWFGTNICVISDAIYRELGPQSRLKKPKRVY